MTIQLETRDCHVAQSSLNVSAVNPKMSPIKSIFSPKFYLLL